MSTQNESQRLTTAHGIPVSDNQNSLTAGRFGPVLLTDFHLVEKLAHFNRERIPERVVHAKGAGAYGYLEITKDIKGLELRIIELEALLRERAR